mmetsp:Transcript_14131/g.35025  ORF Transcript_14131/g.35025 Transcript_14131/m.35025 type:complete len:224 (-) Transcript_14131:863-1534(-)
MVQHTHEGHPVKLVQLAVHAQHLANPVKLAPEKQHDGHYQHRHHHRHEAQAVDRGRPAEADLTEFRRVRQRRVVVEGVVVVLRKAAHARLEDDDVLDPDERDDGDHDALVVVVQRGVGQRLDHGRALDCERDKGENHRQSDGETIGKCVGARVVIKRHVQRKSRGDHLQALNEEVEPIAAPPACEQDVELVGYVLAIATAKPSHHHLTERHCVAWPRMRRNFS